MSEATPTCFPRIAPSGLDGLVITFADRFEDEANRAALALRAEIEAACWPEVVETAPSLVSTLVRFDPLATRIEALAERLRKLLAGRDWRAAPLPQGRRLIAIPTCFDPDLARAYHDEDLDVDTDFCAMCGHDWCSVRISKEIQEFASGKANEYAWERAKKSNALTAEQKAILEQRGVLSPEEIHKLAAKTKKAVGAATGKKADCHSDYVAPDEAAQKQQELVSLQVSR